MASGNKFNALAAAMPNGGVNFGSDTIKVMLTNTLPVAANSVYSDISSNELGNGNGYTTGGFACTLVSSTQTSGTYKYIATAVSAGVTWTASGAMGPFRYVVMYDTAGSKYLIGWWDYGSPLTLSATQTFTVTLDPTNGVLQLS